MTYLANRDVNRLAAHSTLHQLAWSVSGVFYWTCYHAFFAALGDVEHRGWQLAVRQALGALAGVLGPAACGVILASFGPWVAFGASAVIETAAALPLFAVTEPRFSSAAPRDAYKSARMGFCLFCTDGWIVCCSAIAWDIFAFRALDARYDAFGGVLAGAALAGALGGMVLGRVIDAGHAKRVAWISATVMSGILASSG